MTRPKAALLLLLAAAVWGLAFLFQKSAMRHVGPLTFIAARGVVASMALAPWAWREWQQSSRERGATLWSWSSAGGIAFFVAACLQQSGLQTTSVTNSGFLTALYVVITPFIAWAFTRHAPSPYVWFAVAVSALGTWLLGGGTLSSFSKGDAEVAASALFWAGHVVITARASRFERPLMFMLVGFAIVAALGSLGACLWEAPSVAGLAQAAVEIAYVGLLSSALAFLLLILALRHVPPAEAAVIASVETVFSAGAAHAFLGERLPALGWLGAALILAATVLVQVVPSLSLRAARAVQPE
jgi:drug/metabolite transporter (DMT)-like permease